MPSEIICTPESLVDAAKCYTCIPVGMQREVLIYLLNVMSGLNYTPQQLMDSAKFMKCIPIGMQDEVITYLLCQIANLT